MTHHIPAQHFITGLRTAIERSLLNGFTRSFTLMRAAFKQPSDVELNPHLRYDCGEDDVRAQAPQTLLQKQATRANMLGTMLLRSI